MRTKVWYWMGIAISLKRRHTRRTATMSRRPCSRTYERARQGVNDESRHINGGDPARACRGEGVERIGREVSTEKWKGHKRTKKLYLHA